MSLFDSLGEDVRLLLEGEDSYTVPVLFESPPPANTQFGTLDPQDTQNHIRAFIKDHYTQIDLETGAPQEGLSASLSITLKTLLDKGIIDDVADPDLKNWKVSWMDITDPTKQRDFLINRIHPTRTLTHIVLMLGEIEIT